MHPVHRHVKSSNCKYVEKYKIENHIAIQTELDRDFTVLERKFNNLRASYTQHNESNSRSVIRSDTGQLCGAMTE